MESKLTVSYLLALVLQISIIERESGVTDRSIAASEALQNLPLYLAQEPSEALEVLGAVEAFISEQRVVLGQC